jgi:ribosomal protein S27AE
MSHHDRKTIDFLTAENHMVKNTRMYCGNCGILLKADNHIDKIENNPNHPSKNKKCHYCGMKDADIIEREVTDGTSPGVKHLAAPDWSQYPPAVLNPDETFEGQDPKKNRLSRNNGN